MCYSRSSSSQLITDIFLNLFQILIGAILSGVVPLDSEAQVVTLSFSRICRHSLSDMLIGVGLRVCIHRSECACVCEHLYLYRVSQKKTQMLTISLYYKVQTLYILNRALQLLSATTS